MVLADVSAFAGGTPTFFAGVPLVSATKSHIPVAASYGLGCGPAEGGADDGAADGGAVAASVLESPPPMSATAAKIPPTTTSTPTLVPRSAKRLARACRSARLCIWRS